MHCTRGGQIVARGPNVARQNIFSGLQKHSGKSSNLKLQQGVTAGIKLDLQNIPNKAATNLFQVDLHKP